MELGETPDLLDGFEGVESASGVELPWRWSEIEDRGAGKGIRVLELLRIGLGLSLGGENSEVGSREVGFESWTGELRDEVDKFETAADIALWIGYSGWVTAALSV